MTPPPSSRAPSMAERNETNPMPDFLRALADVIRRDQGEPWTVQMLRDAAGQIEALETRVAELLTQERADVAA